MNPLSTYASQTPGQRSFVNDLETAAWSRAGVQHCKLNALDLDQITSLDIQHTGTDYLIEPNPHATEAAGRPWVPVMRHLGVDSQGRCTAVLTRGFDPYMLVEANEMCVTPQHTKELKKYLNEAMLNVMPYEDPVTVAESLAKRRKYPAYQPNAMPWTAWARALFNATQDLRSARNPEPVIDVQVVYKRTQRMYHEHVQPFYKIVATLPLYIPILRNLILDGPHDVFHTSVPLENAEAARLWRKARGDPSCVQQSMLYTSHMRAKDLSPEERRISERYFLFNMPFEDTIKFEMRYMIDHGNMPGCGWIRIHPKKAKAIFNVNTESIQGEFIRTTTCDTEFHFLTEGEDCISFHDPIKEPEFDKTAPLTLLCFDGEMNNMPDGTFPKPEKAEVIQLGVSIMNTHQKEIQHRIILTWKECAPFDDSQNVTIYSFDREQEMLLAFYDLVRFVDPDLIVGFNTDGFDWPYIFDRCRKLRMMDPTVAQISRIMQTRVFVRSTKMNSRAYGNNEIKEAVISGRISWDLMKWFKRNYKQRSYGLNACSEQYLGAQKVEMAYDMLGPLQRGTPQDRAKIARYVDMDAQLPLRLMTKLSTLAKEMETCRVTGIQLHEVLSRGAAIRVLRKVIGFMNQNGFLLPNERAYNDKGVPQGFFKKWIEDNFGTEAETPTTHIHGQKRTVHDDSQEEDHASEEYWDKIEKELIEAFSAERRKKKKTNGADSDGEDEEEDEVDDSYIGAKVLEAIKGFYTKHAVWTLDFSSLYPSIMLAFNLCPTTQITILQALELNLQAIARFLKGRVRAGRKFYSAVRLERVLRSLTPPETYSPETRLQMSHAVMNRFKLELDYHITPAGHYFVKPHIRVGMVQAALRIILAARKKAQAEMNEFNEASFDYMVRAVRQLALKLVANSTYGVFGQKLSPEYTRAVAESVTAYGRQMIEEGVKNMVETKFCKQNGYSFDASVIYGDTDSVMIKIPIDAFCSCGMTERTGQALHEHAEHCHIDPKVRSDLINELVPVLEAHAARLEKTPGKEAQAKNVRDQIQSCHTGTGMAAGLLFGRVMAAHATALFKDMPPINMEFEKVYFPYLLISKKRYAGLKYIIPNENEPWAIRTPAKPDVKGLETMRRDTIIYTAQAQAKVIKTLMEKRSIQAGLEAVYECIDSVHQGKVNIHDFILSKQLNEWPKDAKSQQTHAHLAARLKARGKGSIPKIGDRIPYVIRASADKHAKQYTLGEDPLEALNENIPINTAYYLERKIIPPLSRLFAVHFGGKKEAMDHFLARKIKMVKPPASTEKGSIGSFFKPAPKCKCCHVQEAKRDGIYCHACVESGKTGDEVAIHARNAETRNAMIETYREHVVHCNVTCQKNDPATIPRDIEHADVVCSNKDCSRLYARVAHQKKMKRLLDTI